MRTRAVVAGLMVTLAMGACATLGRQAFVQPVVNFKDVQLKGLGLTGGSVDVVLSVYNPNNFRLDATKLTYNLFVGDTIPFGQGTLDKTFTVQDKDSTIVHIPLSFSYSGLGAAGRELMNSGSVKYRVNGDLTVGTPIGNFTRPYDQTGTFSTLSR